MSNDRDFDHAIPADSHNTPPPNNVAGPVPGTSDENDNEVVTEPSTSNDQTGPMTSGGNSSNTNSGLPAGGGNVHRWVEQMKQEWNYIEYMELVFYMDLVGGHGIFSEGLRQKITREMSKPKYMARGARNSRCSVWDGIRSVLPNPIEGGPVIEEHELWVFVLRTEANAKLFNEYEENPRCLTTMCEMVNSIRQHGHICEEDYREYQNGDGAAIEYYYSDSEDMDCSSDDE